MKISRAMGLSFLFVALGFSGTAAATDVIAGYDLWSTPAGGAVEDFGGAATPDPDDNSPAIPSGFFDGGDDGFVGAIQFVGDPLGTFLGQPTGNADTIVQRLSTASLGSVPSSDTIPIELVALSLVSTSPINVGGSGNWDVRVDLSGTNPSTGTMTIDHTTPGGGIYGATIHVCPVFTFSRVSNPVDTRVLDACGQGFNPNPISVTGNDWVHDAVLPLESPLSGPNFFVTGLTEHTGPHPAADPIETPSASAVPAATMWALVLVAGLFLTLLGFRASRRAA